MSMFRMPKNNSLPSTKPTMPIRMSTTPMTCAYLFNTTSDRLLPLHAPTRARMFIASYASHGVADHRQHASDPHLPACMESPEAAVRLPSRRWMRYCGRRGASDPPGTRRGSQARGGWPDRGVHL